MKVCRSFLAVGRALLLVMLLVMGWGMPAGATMLDGYAALCTAVAAGTCSELASAGYARQPVSFSDAVLGASVNATPLSFGAGGVGPIAGRAVYDAPAGGNLIAVIPLATPLVQTPQNLADVGSIRLTIAALSAFQNSKLYSGTVAPGAALGATPDGSTVTAGVKDVFRSGVLTAALPSFDASYTGPVPQVTGFAITGLTNQASFILSGAGTLASGSLTLPATPTDGQSFRFSCAVTVTTLAVNVVTGQSLVGSPTTCGPTAGHEWFYAGGVAKTWFALF